MAATAEQARERRGRAVGHLEGLYGVVIAAGLGIAVTNTVSPAEDRLHVAWDHVPLLVAFLVVVVPFYHGALLHLDNKYRLDAGRHHQTSALLVDFIGLFLEAVVIVAFASSVGRVRSFVISLVVLLVIDVAWAALAWAPDRCRAKKRGDGLLSWVQVNAATICVLCVVAVALAQFRASDGVLTAAVLVIVSMRSAADYALNWGFYGGELMAPSQWPTSGIPSRDGGVISRDRRTTYSVPSSAGALYMPELKHRHKVPSDV